MYHLFIAQRFSGVSIEPDSEWPDLWRIRQSERLSGALNLTRAREAALACARPRGLGGHEVVRWHRRETGCVSSPIELPEAA
jgi:hypothetical protein